MKQSTDKQQTARLIELGGREPKTIVDKYYDFDAEDYAEVKAYSIGELIEILEEVASVVISYSYQKNGYYVRVIIPKREGGGMYRISQTELVDALYDMVVKLIEEGVIRSNNYMVVITSEEIEGTQPRVQINKAPTI